MQQVLDYLKLHQKRFVEELCEYVRFRSVSAQPVHGKDMAACTDWLVKHCRSIGLAAEVRPTRGHPVVIAKTPRKKSSPKRHFLVYGHYDVQPAEPFNLWKSPPFDPRIAGGFLYARGASDNKGQNLAHLKTVEAYLKTGTELPCDITFLLEGEEEVGSRNLPAFLRKHRAELRGDGIVISDTGMPSPKLPALGYSLRGLAAFEIMVHGPSRDLHSGIFGGSVLNPAIALSAMLAKVHDKNGHVTIPGFYDGVQALTRAERRELARLPFNAAQYRKSLGVPALYGERGFTPVEQFSARPTFEINGLTSGYQGAGGKTIVPSWARAKVTTRLVPDQDPRQVVKAVCSFFKRQCPPGVRLEITSDEGARAYYVSPDSADAKAALRSLAQAFGRKPVLLREGGSIPILNEFKAILGMDALLVGLAVAEDNAHSPNESFSLDRFEKGQKMAAYLWQELAAVRS